MLGDLEHQAVAAVLGFDRIQNRRQMAFELHVDDGADDLRDASGLIGRCSHENSLLEFRKLKRRQFDGILPLVAFEYGQTVGFFNQLLELSPCRHPPTSTSEGIR